MASFLLEVLHAHKLIYLVSKMSILTILIFIPTEMIFIFVLCFFYVIGMKMCSRYNQGLFPTFINAYSIYSFE